MKKTTLFILVVAVIGCQKKTVVDSSSPQSRPTTPVFQKIESSQSGISFSNSIEPNIETKENLFDFDYFYNGAGVAVGDINNDGLDDLFFTANQGENQLYLNKGNLQFENITQKAGLNTSKQWSNGVTLADVNQDGWLDIYVSQGGPFEATQRKNLLFINQGDLTFKESAEQYGLADSGFSTQSAFFDYDKDGDLDCLVMNENALYGLDPVRFLSILNERPDLLHESSSHLYKNEAGVFVDVTVEAGLLRPSFGLGLVVSDVDGDNWLDIYMANDYYLPDALYLNQKNGKFSEQIKERTKQVSFYGMGADIADVDNDGLQDIYVLDMASSDHYRAKTLMASMNVENFQLLVDRLQFQHQYMFNSLQINQGNNRYINLAHMAGVAKTDWSWAGLITDLDNNESKEIFVTNGYRKYALDNDLKNKVAQVQMEYQGQVPLEVKQELYEEMPTEKLANILYFQSENLYFEDVAAQWGLPEKTYSNGAAFADLDQDGDLELIINNMDEEAFLYQNLSREKELGNYLRVKTIGPTSESFAKVTIKYAGKQQVFESKRVRGYLSAVDPVAHFGVGTHRRIDTVRVEWLSGEVEERYKVKVNQVLEFRIEGAQEVTSVATNQKSTKKWFEPASVGDLKLFYRHQENDYNDFAKEILLPYKQSTLGPFITRGDVNGDGREDLYLGGAAGQPGRLLVQNEDGFERLEVSAFAADRRYEDMEVVFWDLDNDGDQDLYVVSGGNAFVTGSENYQDRLYLNQGNGDFVPANERIAERPAYSGKSVGVIDYDRDGDLDLIVGNRINGQDYPRAASSIIYRNDDGHLVDVTDEVAPALTGFGIVNKVLPVDINNDGWEDFVVLGEWTHVGIFENREGNFEDISGQSGLDQDQGWWFTAAVTDVNKDGLPDLIAGNVGLNSKYKASYEKPLKVFLNDFDQNGSLDIVLSKDYKGEYVPFRGRECSSQQMPFIVDKFPTYNEFASASLEEVYGEGLNDALERQATEFRSLLLLNRGGGKFDKVPLPRLAQAFPLLACTFYDLNQDGFEDAILAGDIYNTEVETPRLDMGTSIVLLSDGSGGYGKAMGPGKTGLYIPGNVKSLELIELETMEGAYLIAGRNNDLLSLFRLKP